MVSRHLQRQTYHLQTETQMMPETQKSPGLKAKGQMVNHWTPTGTRLSLQSSSLWAEKQSSSRRAGCCFIGMGSRKRTMIPPTNNSLCSGSHLSSGTYHFGQSSIDLAGLHVAALALRCGNQPIPCQKQRHCQVPIHICLCHPDRGGPAWAGPTAVMDSEKW